jgi:hypothetical protein
MGCCGQNRAALAQTMNPQQANGLPSAKATSLRFIQRRSILVRGPVTGRSYHFSGGASTRGIDARDAAGLLKSGYFSIATE